MQPELSILIPALFERQSKLPGYLVSQIGDLPVELLVLSDNRKRSTGYKRQALLDMARGRYITHLDDDDWVAPTYIKDVLEAIALDYSKPWPTGLADVITIEQECVWNGENPYIVRCDLGFENETMHKDADDKLWQDIKRKPWAWCIWNAIIAKQALFPDGYIDDDWFWLKQVLTRASAQRKINKVLHFYRYNSKTSASNQGEPTVTTP